MAKLKWCMAIVFATLIGGPSASNRASAQGESTCDCPRFVPLAKPCRLFDTRLGEQGGPMITSMAEGDGHSSVIRFFHVRNESNCNLPSSAKAVAYNWTVVGTFNKQAFRGHVTLYPSNISTPATSSINFHPLQTIANGGIIALNPYASNETLDLAAKLVLADGDVPSLGGAVYVVMDVTGYFR